MVDAAELIVLLDADDDKSELFWTRRVLFSALVVVVEGSVSCTAGARVRLTILSGAIGGRFDVRSPAEFSRLRLPVLVTPLLPGGAWTDANPFRLSCLRLRPAKKLAEDDVGGLGRSSADKPFAPPEPTAFTLSAQD